MSDQKTQQVLSTLARLERQQNSDTNLVRRQFRRYAVRGEAELYGIGEMAPDREPLRVQIRDVGWGGLGFLSQEELPRGSMWRVCFLRSGFVIGAQTILIRHVSKVGQGLHLVGGQFCLEAGLMCLLGVDAMAIREGMVGDAPTETAYLPPTEVA